MSYEVLLTSANAPNGVGEYQWENTDQVISVPDDVALQLLRIPSGGYEQVDNHDARPKKKNAKGQTPEEHNAAIAAAALADEQAQPGLVDQLTSAPELI